MYMIVCKLKGYKGEHFVITDRLKNATSDKERSEVLKRTIKENANWEYAKLVKKVVYYEDVEIYEDK